MFWNPWLSPALLRFNHLKPNRIWMVLARYLWIMCPFFGRYHGTWQCHSISIDFLLLMIWPWTFPLLYFIGETEAFWILGLLNNFLYVVMNAGAENINEASSRAAGGSTLVWLHRWGSTGPWWRSKTIPWFGMIWGCLENVIPNLEWLYMYQYISQFFPCLGIIWNGYFEILIAIPTIGRFSGFPWDDRSFRDRLADGRLESLWFTWSTFCRDLDERWWKSHPEGWFVEHPWVAGFNAVYRSQL